MWFGEELCMLYVATPNTTKDGKYLFSAGSSMLNILFLVFPGVISIKITEWCRSGLLSHGIGAASFTRAATP